jgi:hypothetical protein
MKIFRYIQAFLLLIISVSLVSAQESFQVSEDGINVNASVSEDTNSTIQVLPSTVEIKERATVIVKIKNSEGQPISNHYIALDAPGLIFTQPTEASNSNGEITIEVYANSPGTYTISAFDITYDDLVIDILDSDTLYVTPLDIPFLLEEPVYTKGTTNTLFWNSIGSGYKYYIEVSEYNAFNLIKDASGWITGTMFEFNDLENEKMYFYRVKARNSYGGESEWSNVRYSVQDNQAPEISLLSVGDVGDNNTVEWDSNSAVEIVYKVEDNLSLESTKFYCVREDNSKVECGSTTGSGVLYTTTITLGELQRNGVNDLFSKYVFCVKAKDTAGNSSENCDIEVDIPLWQGKEEEEPERVPISIGRIIRDIVDDTRIAMDDIFEGLDEYTLQDINTFATVGTITVTIGGILGGLLYLPLYLFQVLLSLFSWLGLRKRGKLSGYVYDSRTKEPISQAVVRVYTKGGNLVWTDVTDIRGLFRMGLEDGEYRIEVSARGYKFPSESIFGKSDYPLENVYHGEEFNVAQGVVPEFSIPIDPIEMSTFSKFMTSLRGRFRAIYKVASLLFFVFGLIFSVYTYNRNPNWFNFIIILLYVPSFVLVVRAVFKKSLESGVVTNDKGEPLENIAVGLRDEEYGRIVAKRHTDGNGRYRFIVDKGNYSLEILDTEYEVVEIEEEKLKRLSDGSVLVALDAVVKPIKVEK